MSPQADAVTAVLSSLSKFAMNSEDRFNEVFDAALWACASQQNGALDAQIFAPSGFLLSSF
jgi:hypothetical protein